MTKRAITYSRGTFPITFIESQIIKEGVHADVYKFDNDPSKDLAIIRVAKGHKTPLQRVLKGAKTIEGYKSGNGKLTVTAPDGSTKIHHFVETDATSPTPEIEIRIGELVQWSAESDLIFYEICEPPYQEGRFENLPEPE